MIKKTFTFVDFNGVERTEDHYFHLSKAELARMELSINGGFTEMINRVIAAKDQATLLTVFEDLIQKSYGVKTIDGRGFMKRKEDLEAFMATEAYSQLYMELITNADAAAAFFNGVIPAAN